MPCSTHGTPNSSEPNEMLQNAASHLGLLCMPSFRSYSAILQLLPLLLHSPGLTWSAGEFLSRKSINGGNLSGVPLLE